MPHVAAPRSLALALLLGLYALKLIWRPDRVDVKDWVVEQWQTLDQVAELQELRTDDQLVRV